MPIFAIFRLNSPLFSAVFHAKNSYNSAKTPNSAFRYFVHLQPLLARFVLPSYANIACIRRQLAHLIAYTAYQRLFARLPLPSVVACPSFPGRTAFYLLSATHLHFPALPLHNARILSVLKSNRPLSFLASLSSRAPFRGVARVLFTPRPYSHG